jgi:uncharacterized phiE125 gp8 family phage protein
MGQSTPPHKRLHSHTLKNEDAMLKTLVTAPASEPLTLSEAKDWLRVSDASEDTTITALIKSARLTVEAESRCQLIEQVWRLKLDQWPGSGVVEPLLRPLMAIDAARIFDANNVSQSVVLSALRLDAAAGMIFTGAVPFPGRTKFGIEIDVRVGFAATANAVPEALRQALRLLVAHRFENRGDASAALPPGVSALVAPFRNPRLI